MSEHQDIHLPVAENPEPVNRFAKAHLILIYSLAAAFVIWLLTGFYQIQANQVAIIERLGQYIADDTGQPIEMSPGLHYHLPWPIDNVHIISNQQTPTLVINEFNTIPEEYKLYREAQMKSGNMTMDALNALTNPYLITADKNIINMEVRITYRIDNPPGWLNTVSHDDAAAGSTSDMRERIFRQLAQRALVKQIGNMTLEQVMFTQRAELISQLQNVMQNELQIYDTTVRGGNLISLGINIQKVDISELRPPDAARSAFDDVARARSTQSVVVNNAKSESDAAIARATGEKSTLIAGAQSYATTAIQTAKGEMSRFQQIFEQYSANPAQARFNLYAEAVKVITDASTRIFYAVPGQRTQIQIDPPVNDAGQTPIR